ncbi:hypothetical protein [Phaffia rhodozyma]|uniref:Uncharacterized protein n=1 Tax=Phaffia rhodozyma TaxID=264483 RepID=A0A0F7SEB7_PHARH|nr:hypothetical protein [Phaffia rhodozyma]
MTAVSIYSKHLPSQVDILILGAGWLSQFLLPLLASSKLTYVATTRSGETHYPSVPVDYPLQKFKFDPEDSKKTVGESFRKLPKARVVLVTFPLRK